MRLLSRVLGKLIGQSVVQESNPKTMQILLREYYKEMQQNGRQAPVIASTGFSAYSQSDEDGLLLFVFSLIGEGKRVCVEMASGYPIGANTTNLICNWNWSGYLFEGNERLAGRARAFFSQSRDTWLYPPSVIHTWLSRENVNEVMAREGLSGPIDLLCIDVDGMDYWLWKEINVVTPRVVVIEYANFWPASKSVTVPYKKDFVRSSTHPDYFGCSLLALERLGAEKGYRLVGCNKYGFNAIFLQEDLAIRELPTATVEECLSLPHPLRSQMTRLKAIESLPWLEV